MTGARGLTISHQPQRLMISTIPAVESTRLSHLGKSHPPLPSESSWEIRFRFLLGNWAVSQTSGSLLKHKNTPGSFEPLRIKLTTKTKIYHPPKKQWHCFTWNLRPKSQCLCWYVSVSQLNAGWFSRWVPEPSSWNPVGYVSRCQTLGAKISAQKLGELRSPWSFQIPWGSAWGKKIHQSCWRRPAQPSPEDPGPVNLAEEMVEFWIADACEIWNEGT